MDDVFCAFYRVAWFPRGLDCTLSREKKRPCTRSVALARETLISTHALPVVETETSPFKIFCRQKFEERSASRLRIAQSSSVMTIGDGN